MLKKILLISGILLLAVSIWFYLNRTSIMLSMITDYEPYTFEKVLSDPALRQNYGIGDHSKPEDYGFSSEEHQFKSLDGTMLSGWYVQNNANSDRCILFAHGRTSNRLKPMKYLALIDSLRLDTLYNVFIPDLRNSGRSASAKTYMGYKFAEDIAAAILLAYDRNKQKRFIIYGFSMGAMAALNVVGRADLKRLMKDRDIEVTHLILDSPLANVHATLKGAVKDNALASGIFDEVYADYSKAIDNFGDHMRLSALLPAELPTLILQSTNDQLTNHAILEQEMAKLKTHSMKVIFYSGPGHVKVFQDSRTRTKYIADVEDFLLTN